MRPFFVLAARALRGHVGDRRRPYKLTLVLTYRCGLRCSMCSIWEKRPEGELTLDEVRQFAGRSGFFSWINLTGGELFLRDDAMEIARVLIAGNRDLYLMDFPTSAQAPDRVVRGVRELLDTRLPRLAVTVSIDGPPELHDGIRGVPGSFEKAAWVLRELGAIGDRRLEAHAGMTLHEANAGVVDETLAALQAAVPGFDRGRLHLNVAQRSAHYYANESGNGFATGDGVRRAVRAALERRPFALAPIPLLERAYLRGVPEFLDTGRSPVPCAALSSSVFVDPAWDVYPCLTWGARIGNLRDWAFDLDPLFRSPRARALRGDVRADRCPGCWTPCEALPSLVSRLPEVLW